MKLPLGEPLGADETGVFSGHLYEVHTFRQIADEVAVTLDIGERFHLAAQKIIYGNVLNGLAGADSDIIHSRIGENLKRSVFYLANRTGIVAGIGELRLNGQGKNDK